MDPDGSSKDPGGGGGTYTKPLPERPPSRTRRSRSEPGVKFSAIYSNTGNADMSFDSTFLKIGDRVSLWSEGETSQLCGFVSTLG